MEIVQHNQLEQQASQARHRCRWWLKPNNRGWRATGLIICPNSLSFIIFCIKWLNPALSLLSSWFLAAETRQLFGISCVRLIEVSLCCSCATISGSMYCIFIHSQFNESSATIKIWKISLHQNITVDWCCWLIMPSSSCYFKIALYSPRIWVDWSRQVAAAISRLLCTPPESGLTDHDK